VDRHFAYKNISFDYCLILENRKTISAMVLPSQALVVRAPFEATDDRVYDFLCRKFRWILKQQRYFAQFQSEEEKRFVSGETFRYRGRSYKLLLRKDIRNEHVSLQHGTLTAYMFSPKDHARAKQLLEEWYLKKANKVLSERLSTCFFLFDYEEMPTLVIRKMSKRWGSYMHKTNKIYLNQELIKASKRHIDYVIIHELCHTIHKLHNRAFYSLLESKLPQWEKLKTELELGLFGSP